MQVQELQNPKLLSLGAAVKKRESYRIEGKRLVLTNGVFDLLHAGHLYFLQEAAKRGDVLWVMLNSDCSTRALKGPRRPVQGEQERAFALAALACVDAVVLFQKKRLVAEIEALRPDIYVKAGDYDIGSIHEAERDALLSVGAEIQFLGFLKGFSTTNLIQKIAQAAETF